MKTGWRVFKKIRRLLAVTPVGIELVLVGAGVITGVVLTRASQSPEPAIAAVAAPSPDPTSDKSVEPTPSARVLARIAPAAGRRLKMFEPRAEPLPAWRKFAVAPSPVDDRPVIAVIIDDMGLDRRRSARTAELPAPLTLAYLPYARDLVRQTRAARSLGHELMVHIPMEPARSGDDPGPNALRLKISPRELMRRLDWSLKRFPGFVGISNHMGSGLTAHAERMRLIMRELKTRGLLFIDSRTSGRSVAARVARQEGVPAAVRNVFLDHDDDADAIRRQLGILEKIARRRGYAVGIGHPRDLTIKALRRWLGEARRKGFALVPVSAIVRRANPTG